MLRLALVLILLLGTSALARAEADGPDFFRVTGVAADDILNLRAEPDGGAARLGAIPPGTDGLRNLGCRGGLSYAERAEATEAERAAAAGDRWCRVAWGGREGWVAARFLAEGAAPAGAAAGVPLSPEDGGPRRFEVTGVSTTLNLRAEPSVAAPVIDRYAPGAILSNLGCRVGEGRAWCDVQSMFGGPRGYVAATYLAPARGPDGRVPTGYDDSALRAGQGEFDATGSIPCAEAAGRPMVRCAFGVARGVGGDATVVATRPDGRTRAIFFVHGRAVGAGVAQADGDRPFSARREGDLTLIRVGPERYEIPDAAPLGG